jgi:uncharacterized protein (TIGR03083 family)
MVAIYDTFADALGDGRTILASPAVAEQWTRPGALTGMSVGGVAAHLVMSVKALVGVFEGREVNAPELQGGPERPPVRRTSASFLAFARFRSPADAETEMSRWVQSKAEADAAKGPAAVLDRYDRGIPQIRALLEKVPPDQEVTAPVNVVMTAADYVATRLVELVVHADDLAASVGAEPPPFTEAATGAVLDILMGAVRRRSGDLTVIRALTRRERAEADVLLAL